MYQFKFEPLLDHRRFLEESIQRDLALSQKLLVKEEKQLERLFAEEQQVQYDLKQKQKQTINSHEFILCQRFLERLAEKIKQRKLKILEAQAKVESTRVELIEASRKRETLEKLKEKGLAAYNRKLAKHEQDCLNESAVIRFYHHQIDKRNRGFS